MFLYKHLYTCLLKEIYAFNILSDNIHDIIVTWSTKNDTKESIVEYGIGGFILRAEGNSTLFVDGGEKKRKQYIHRVWLKNLTPNSKYSKTSVLLFATNYSQLLLH